MAGSEILRTGREPSCLEGNAFMLTVLSDGSGFASRPGFRRVSPT